MTNKWPGIGYKILIPSIHQPTTLVATCPLSRGRGTRRCWDQQPMWMADMVRGRINNSKICDPKTDVKEFYSILGIWWESYQIYYIDCLQNSWGMFSITSNIISSLSSDLLGWTRMTSKFILICSPLCKYIYPCFSAANFLSATSSQPSAWSLRKAIIKMVTFEFFFKHLSKTLEIEILMN